MQIVISDIFKQPAFVAQ